MFWTKVKLTAVGVLLASLLGVGLGLRVQSVSAEEPQPEEPKPEEVQPEETTPAQPAETAPRAAPELSHSSAARDRAPR